jgi:hypothetical protein
MGHRPPAVAQAKGTRRSGVEQEFQFGRQVLGVLVLRRRVAEGPPVGRSAAEGPLGKGEEGEFGADRRVPDERESPEVRSRAVMQWLLRSPGNSSASVNPDPQDGNPGNGCGRSARTTAVRRVSHQATCMERRARGLGVVGVIAASPLTLLR